MWVKEGRGEQQIFNHLWWWLQEWCNGEHVCNIENPALGLSIGGDTRVLGAGKALNDSPAGGHDTLTKDTQTAWHLQPSFPRWQPVIARCIKWSSHFQEIWDLDMDLNGAMTLEIRRNTIIRIGKQHSGTLNDQPASQPILCIIYVKYWCHFVAGWLLYPWNMKKITV